MHIQYTSVDLASLLIYHFCVGERSNLKKILRTRKIMVTPSNERGECRLRTLVHHKRKRYDNAVDVVVRLHDRPI